jgi:hypothetical protein
MDVTPVCEYGNGFGHRFLCLWFAVHTGGGDECISAIDGQVSKSLLPSGVCFAWFLLVWASDSLNWTAVSIGTQTGRFERTALKKCAEGDVPTLDIEYTRSPFSFAGVPGCKGVRNRGGRMPVFSRGRVTDHILTVCAKQSLVPLAGRMTPPGKE